MNMEDAIFLLTYVKKGEFSDLPKEDIGKDYPMASCSRCHHQMETERNLLE
jgi:hypothetical protein